MLEIYSEIDIRVPGDTYFAFEDSTYYLLHTEPRGYGFDATLFEEVDMPSEHRSAISETCIIQGAVEEILNDFEYALRSLEDDGDLDRESLIAAWEEA